MSGKRFIFILIASVFLLTSCVHYIQSGRETVKIIDKYLAEVVEKTKKASCMIIYQDSKMVAGGSGFFISEDGYLLTNYHVIAFYLEENYSADKKHLTVSPFNGGDYEVEVIGWDKYLDVALLKIEAFEGEEFPFLTFGNYADVKPGHTIFAVGSPAALKNSVSKGVVSNSDFVDIASIQKRFHPYFMQFDAVQGQGSSGGPIVNIDGEVIAVSDLVVPVRGGVFGLGIPVVFIKKILDSLYEGGEIERGSLGMDAIGIKEKGVYVWNVKSGSAADKVGIEPGDKIIKFKDSDISDNEEWLMNLIYRCFAGDEVQITVEREGKKVVLTAVLDKLEVSSSIKTSGGNYMEK